MKNRHQRRGMHLKGECPSEEDNMNRKNDNVEAEALAAYEPVNSEFRERAHMDWRTGEKGINMYGLRWKYVRLTLEE
jgi:hypothetical protein